MSEQTDTYTEQVLRAYVECALWSESIGEDFLARWEAAHPDEVDTFAYDTSLEGFGFTMDDIAPESLAQMREDIETFTDELPRGADAWSAEQLGHDFWLTRNHHGAGFWDRGRGNVGQMLTARAEGHGESTLYVGDDGLVYVA